ncbi:helix-turn-helix domain-containing protein [Xanthomonas sp. WHRI 1810A]|uniref:helix-turn-helix domain-containing protein n=1 Tax=Xanthomonas sp. WHRI 1810A TaxID=3161565 RepID=UPI0032E87360
MDSLGSRLREERRRLGLTQQALAQLGHVEANSQALYESGKRIPRADYLASVAVGGIDLLYVVLAKRMPLALESLTDEESMVVCDYRTLDLGDRLAFKRLSSSLSDREQVKYAQPR